MWDTYWQGRGSPWEYDPGPPRNRSWARLFAETPNYRGLGLALTGQEQFRWHFGPMFYRGRLRDRQVKVLIVGQEGAQDESLSHRSFTGGTGGRMQQLLNHLGITHSYVFMNTFVYPIFGQYGSAERLMGQHSRSPIRIHRELLFDYVVARNDLQLVVAVGRAAKESVASWIGSHGGSADPDALHLADAAVVAPHLRAVGVLHPGGASKGGAVTAIKASFVDAIAQVEAWSAADPAWLVPDPGSSRAPANAYTYASAPIPFRDFPYGTPWRLGRQSTSSNRKDDQRAIQIFGEHGTYNNTGDNLIYVGDAAGSTNGYDDDPTDLPYEPPRVRYRDFDAGPTASFARLLQGATTQFPWPDFAGLGLSSDPSFGAGPAYRGRLSAPSILVVADQRSHDDLFSGRALTGDAGQHLQAFLEAAGVTTSYCILAVLPVDTLEDDQVAVRAAVDTAEVRSLYAEAVRRVRPQVTILSGPLAQRLGGHITPAGTPAIPMLAHSQPGWVADWGRALGELQPLHYRRDLTSPTFAYQGERTQIARSDLPYGTLRWQGSSGDRGLQPKQGGSASFDYYKLVMPRWAFELAPVPLIPSEQAAVDVMAAG